MATVISRRPFALVTIAVAFLFNILVKKAAGETDSGRITMRFSARGLPPTDASGSPDPFLEVYVIESSTDEPRKVLKTKTIMDTADPDFPENITVDCKHDMQTIKVQAWDADPLGDDYLGQATVTMHELLNDCFGNICKKALRHGDVVDGVLVFHGILDNEADDNDGSAL